MKKYMNFCKILISDIKKLFIFTIFITTMVHISSYALPYANKILIDSIFFEKSYSSLPTIITFFALITIFTKGIFRLERYLVTLQDERIGNEIRKKVLKGIYNKDYVDYNKISYGHVETLLTNNISIINNSIYSIIESAIALPISIIIVSLYVFTLTPTLIFILALEIISIFLISKISGNISARKYKEQIEGQNKYFHNLERSFNLYENTRMNFNQSYIFKKLSNVSLLYRNKNISYFRTESLISWAFEFSEIIFDIIIIIIFAFLVKNKSVTPGDYFAYMGMKVLIIGTLNGVGKVHIRYKEMKVAIDDFNSVVNLEDYSKYEYIQNQSLNEKISKITFDNVIFKYKSNKMTYNFNYEFNRGSVYIVRGINGIGKTTLIRLLTGLCKPEKGNVLLNDNMKIDDIKREELYHKIKVLAQSPVLYEDTIRNNISPHEKSENLFNEKFKDLSEYFGMTELLSTYEKGLDSYVWEDGRKLSGGQIKKIALMNLFYEDPDLIVLDEPFGELDINSKTKLYDYIKKIQKDKIIIIISHEDKCQYNSNEIFLDFKVNQKQVVEIKEFNSRKKIPKIL